MCQRCEPSAPSSTTLGSGPWIRYGRGVQSGHRESGDQSNRPSRVPSRPGPSPGGFGLLLVRQLVDEVMYSEAGNEVLLIKHTQ